MPINFSLLVDEYAELANIDTIQWQQGSHFSLSAENIEINVGFIEESNKVVVVSYLSVFANESIYKKLLKANFALQDIEIGCLGLTPQGEVTLNIKQDASHLDAATFDRWITQITQESHRWRELLSLPQLIDDETIVQQGDSSCENLLRI
ncbi:type III secretion system chaperone [Pleionea sp. CnH1-48]|uniref:type III secretion system chaperone n=1 Tax=Pleionea sp. CnH1-48 TaxID=2954494 RepID=UPI002097F711|nr:type III secretion system chaperone [Pleionea sp. CnH1-48]MCO7225963.1 type III secretion system chaperone [Pleionea sp. CnH1-48]